MGVDLEAPRVVPGQGVSMRWLPDGWAGLGRLLADPSADITEGQRCCQALDPLLLNVVLDEKGLDRDPRITATSGVTILHRRLTWSNAGMGLVE